MLDARETNLIVRPVHSCPSCVQCKVEFPCGPAPIRQDSVVCAAEQPSIQLAVRGTAALKAVTIIRNEVDIRRFAPAGTADLDVTFTDEQATKGENRYYVRVEQKDGNMAWTSPVWVTCKK